MDMNKQLVILGAGGHGRVVAEVASLNGYSNIVFLDDSGITEADGHRVVGGISDFEKHLTASAFFVAIGDNGVRTMLLGRLEDKGAQIATLIHPAATVSSKANIGKGSVIMAGAVINNNATVGKGTILNTCCSVDHDCVVGDYSHIAVGAHLAGAVVVGAGVLVGAGAVVSNNTDICDGCTVGAGAVVIRDIKEKGTYVGVPARRIK